MRPSRMVKLDAMLATPIRKSRSISGGAVPVLLQATAIGFALTA